MTWSTLIAIAVAVAQPVPDTLTLEQAIELAYQNAFAIELAESEIDKTKAQVNQAAASLGPRLALNGTYTRFDEPTQFVTGGQPGTQFVTRQTSSQQTASGPIDNKTVSATLSYRLDLFGQVRSLVNSARNFETASEFTLEATRNDVKFGVRQAYFGVLQAIASLQVQQEALQATIDRRENARLLFEAGERAEFDVIRFDTEVSRAEAAVIAAENGVRLAKNALNNTIGIPIETEYKVQPVEPGPAPDDLSPEPFAVTAVAQRPEVAAAAAQVRGLDAAKRAEATGTSPTLDLALTHQRTIDPPAFQREEQTLGTVALNWTIYDANLTRARTRVADENRKQAETRLAQLELGVRLEVRQALVNLENALKQIEVAERTVVQQEEALRLAQLRYDEGEGILLDVTTAQTDLTAARQNLVNANYAYAIALASLQRAMGSDDVSPMAPASGGN